MSEDPATGCTPAATGSTVVCFAAVAAVIWNKCAAPDTGCPVIAVTCSIGERLIATMTTRPLRVLSVLT